MNRTCVRQIVERVRGELHAGGAACIDVSIGTATTHAMTSPSSIAMPTDSRRDARRRAARATRRCL
jgi:hypothetical protein